MSSKDPIIGGKLLSSLRVVDLKQELEQVGLSKSGTKKDLADRLRNYLLAQEKEKADADAVEEEGEEEELPNIAMQEKLAEKNPFLREYFSSQAELFHSQKVAKKLLEEARQSESAPSADEGESASEDKEVTTPEKKVQKVVQVEDGPRQSENIQTPTSVEATESPVKEKDVRVSPRKKQVVEELRPVEIAPTECPAKEHEIDVSLPTQKLVEEVPNPSESETSSSDEDESAEEEKTVKEPVKMSQEKAQSESDSTAEVESATEDAAECEVTSERILEEKLEVLPVESSPNFEGMQETNAEKVVAINKTLKPSAGSRKSSSPKPSQRAERAPSARAEEMEEDLDYGEEDKITTEPPKFDWTRRALRVKNKSAPKTRTKKWVRESNPKVLENINSDSILQWFSEVRLAPSIEKEEKAKENGDVGKLAENDVKFSRTFSIETEGSVPVNVENITITRRVSNTDMVSTQVNDKDADKDLSPARNPQSELILITNLTRPFTLPQLKELLQRTGNLDDLWVDKIKSKCIAKFKEQEEAFETRAALHGVKWPQSNPKALHVDYTNQELLDDYKNRDSGEIKPLMENPVDVVDNMPVREWDMGKRAKSRSPKRRRSKSPGRDPKKPRRTPSPHHRRGSRSPHTDRRSKGDAKDNNEPLSKVLDELFKKTVATPSIYWLPLTPVQIGEKEEMRRKRMIERDRRLAEINKDRPR